MNDRDQQLSKSQCSILDILGGARGKHLRAEEVRGLLRARGRSLHLSTVYRSLQSLTAAGLVKRNFLHENHAHYELAATPGIHLVCSGCGQVREVGTVNEKRVLQAVNKHLGREFTVLDWQMSLTGRCARCSRQAKGGRHAR
jgi:Fur family ferric uptake transcriptional regulator